MGILTEIVYMINFFEQNVKEKIIFIDIENKKIQTTKGLYLVDKDKKNIDKIMYDEIQLVCIDPYLKIFKQINLN